MRELAKTYSTEDVRERDRLAYWREAICEAYVNLGCEAPRQARFDGSISLTEVSSVRLSFVNSGQQHVFRRQQDIARGTDEYFLLSLQLEGVGRVCQDRREAVLRPGDFSLYSSTDPYQLVFQRPFSQLVIQIPKRAILDRIPIADMLTGIAIGGRAGSGKLISDCLTNIAQGVHLVEPEAEAHVSAAVVDLICSSLAQLNGQIPSDVGRQDRLTTLRIESFIASHLKNPDLTRDDVAAGMNMSVRRINELLAKSGTSIMRRIRSARLERIRHELADPASRQTQISTIALKWGFTNLQHFSRAFGKAYGQSARSYRMAQLSCERVDPHSQHNDQGCLPAPIHRAGRGGWRSADAMVQGRADGS